MNKMTAIAIYIALTASPGMFAHAQPASTQDIKPHQTQRAAEPVIRCTHNDAGSHALQPCRVHQSDEGLRLGSSVTQIGRAHV